GVTMAIGMLVHEGSVLIVILNAMRLLRNTQGATSMPKTERTSSGQARSGRTQNDSLEPTTHDSSEPTRSASQSK
ncbi:MAG: hypothetical protein WCY76_01525, partial [Leucobacter sp.]